MKFFYKTLFNKLFENMFLVSAKFGLSAVCVCK